MVPIKYTLKDGVYTFHYKFSDLREYIKRKGALIIISHDTNTNITTNRGYWNMFGCGPSDELYTYKTKRVEEFEGNGPFDPDSVINPKDIELGEWGLLMPKGKFKDPDFKIPDIKWNP